MGEEGRCVVRVLVDRSGNLHDRQIVTSTGFERLDAACIAALTSGHMIPATENGVPIEKFAAIPIIWSLGDKQTTRRPMFGGFQVLDTIVVTAKAKNEDGATPASKSHFASTCYVLMWSRSTGKIQAVQIAKSSGLPGLDDACLKAVINRELFPETRDGKAVDSWAIIPVEFRLVAKSPPQAPIEDVPIAVLAPNQALDIDRVPEGAIPLKDTVCSAHILVSAAGVAEQITVTQSTDSPDLDKICADAIRPLKFIPAQLNGHSIAAAGRRSVFTAGRLSIPIRRPLRE